MKISKKHATLSTIIFVLFFGILTTNTTQAFADGETSENTTLDLTTIMQQQEGPKDLINLKLKLSCSNAKSLSLVIKHSGDAKLKDIRFPNSCFGKKNKLITKYKMYPLKSELHIKVIRKNQVSAICNNDIVAKLTLVVDDMPDGIEPIWPYILNAKVVGDDATITPTITHSGSTGKTNNELVKKQTSMLKLSPSIVKNSTNLTYHFIAGISNIMNLYNITGQLVEQYEINSTAISGTKRLDLTHLPKGVYFLEVIANDKQRFTEKFIKQ